MNWSPQPSVRQLFKSIDEIGQFFELITRFQVQQQTVAARARRAETLRNAAGLEDWSPALVSLSKTFNFLTGGDPCHTFSHRSAWAARRGDAWGHLSCALLEILEPDHCGKSLGGLPSPPSPTVAVPVGAGVGGLAGAGGGALFGLILTGPVGAAVAIGAGLGMMAGAFLGACAASADCTCGCGGRPR